MLKLKISNGVHWVGVMDPHLRIFDVIMPTEHGTTYNSYLIQGKKSTALVDTVKSKFTETFMDKLKGLIDPAELDYIILNHTEQDHTGALGTLLDAAPKAKLISSRNAVPLVKGILNREIDVQAVGDGDELDLGGKTLRFIEAPFLHWPDTMFTYLAEDRILFPCDFLGCHFADDRMFDDLVDDFSYYFRFYYDHIIRPYKEHALKALDKIEGLPITTITPSHGPILRTDVGKWMEKYRSWSSFPGKNKVPCILIFVASAYGNTARMAESIADGIRDGGCEANIFDLEGADSSVFIDRIEAADGIVVGSLTINGDAVKPVWDLLSSLATIKLRGKLAAAFGSYGWSGEAPRLIEERLKGLKLKVPFENVRVHMTPDEEDLARCRELGANLAGALKSRG